MQLSNLSLGLARRFAGGQRVSITYDRFQLYRSGENRLWDEALFDDRPRHALRAHLTAGRPRGWRTSIGAGVRARQGASERSYNVSAGVRSAWN